MDRVGRHRREIRAERRACYGDEQGVQHTPDNRKRAGQQVVEVVDKVRARQRREAFRQFGVGTRRVDKQNVEPDKAKEGHDTENDICDCPAAVNIHTLRGFIFSHVLRLLYLPSLLLSPDILNTISERTPVMINSRTERAPPIP